VSSPEVTVLLADDHAAVRAGTEEHAREGVEHRLTELPRIGKAVERLGPDEPGRYNHDSGDKGSDEGVPVGRRSRDRRRAAPSRGSR